MKGNKARLILIAAGFAAAPVTMAHEIGSGSDAPFDAQPPAESDDMNAESLWQDLLDWVMPEEGEVEQDER